MNKQQEDFCYYYAQSYNQTDAYRKAYNAYDKTLSQATSNASKVAKIPEVKAKVEELRRQKLDELQIGVDRVSMKLAEIAFSDKGDDYYGPNSQIKALELLGRSLGMFTDKVDIKGKVETIYFIEDLKDED